VGDPTSGAKVRPKRKLLFVIAVLVVALAAAEVVMRLALPPMWSRVIPGVGVEKEDCLGLSDDLGYEPIPGVCGRNELGVKVVANPSRSTAARRILLVGDSLSYFSGFADIWQGLLDRSPQLGAWEIWDAGVSGYNLAQERRLLDRLAPQIKPALIVLQLCPNDLYPAAEAVRLGRRARAAFFRPDGSQRMALRATSALRLLDYAFFLALGRPATSGRGGDLGPAGELAAIRDLAGAMRTPVVALTFPHLGADETCDLAAEHRKLAQAITEANLPAFRAETALAAPLTQWRAAPNDPIHPNAAAHALVARAFHEFLSAGGFYGSPSFK
jgi:lysophospholipase L1-like esterase